MRGVCNMSTVVGCKGWLSKIAVVSIRTAVLGMPVSHCHFHDAFADGTDVFA